MFWFYLFHPVLFQTDDVEVEVFPQAVRLVYEDLSGQSVPLSLQEEKKSDFIPEQAFRLKMRVS